MLIRNTLLNKGGYFIKFALIVGEKIPYLPQGAENATENT
jgi:hypothetical protein